MNVHERMAGRVAKILSDADWAAFEALLTADYVEDYPQSGEVIRGRRNARAVRENYPGGLRDASADFSTLRMKTTDQWIRTPAFTIVRVEGAGDSGTAAYRGVYPDGSVWWVIIFYDLRGEQIAKATFFFAPVFDAPEWRKPYREPSLKVTS